MNRVSIRGRSRSLGATGKERGCSGSGLLVMNRMFLESRCVMSNPSKNDCTASHPACSMEHFTWKSIAKKKKHNKETYLASSAQSNTSSAFCGIWPWSRRSRMRWRNPEPPLPSSSGHIIPAGLLPLWLSCSHFSDESKQEAGQRSAKPTEWKRAHGRGGRRGEERRGEERRGGGPSSA